MGANECCDWISISSCFRFFWFTLSQVPPNNNNTHLNLLGPWRFCPYLLYCNIEWTKTRVKIFSLRPKETLQTSRQAEQMKDHHHSSFVDHNRWIVIIILNLESHLGANGARPAAAAASIGRSGKYLSIIYLRTPANRPLFIFTNANNSLSWFLDPCTFLCIYACRCNYWVLGRDFPVGSSAKRSCGLRGEEEEGEDWAERKATFALFLVADSAITVCTCGLLPTSI